jgi:hypothetical protein
MVQQRILDFADQAFERGDGEAFAAALRELNQRLRIYPQFGDPLIDLHYEPGQIRIGICRPISIRYALYEGLRLVLVVEPPVLLRMSSE